MDNAPLIVEYNNEITPDHVVGAGLVWNRLTLLDEILNDHGKDMNFCVHIPGKNGLQEVTKKNVWQDVDIPPLIGANNLLILDMHKGFKMNKVTKITEQKSIDADSAIKNAFL